MEPSGILKWGLQILAYSSILLISIVFHYICDLFATAIAPKIYIGALGNLYDSPQSCVLFVDISKLYSYGL